MAQKRLFLIKEENLNKTKKISKNDVIVFLADTVTNKKNSVYSYLTSIAKESNQTIFGYGIRWTQKWAFKKLNNEDKCDDKNNNKNNHHNNNKSFAEQLIFDNNSLWYFIEFLLHRMDRAYSENKKYIEDVPIARILIYIDCIKEIIKKIRPSEVVIENTETVFNELAVKICKKKGIKITNLKLKEKKQWKRALNNSFVIKKYLKTRILIRKLIGKLFCKKMPSKKIIILTNTRLSNGKNSTDSFWGPLIKQLDKNKIGYKVVEYDQIPVPGSLINAIKRYVPQKYDAQFIGTYYDSKTRKTTKQIVTFLRNKFKELDNQYEFKQSFRYKGIDFYELIRDRLKKIFLAYSPYIGTVYALGKSIIEKEKPEMILIDHEKNYNGKSLLMGIKNQNNKTHSKNKDIYSISLEGEIVYNSNNKLIQVANSDILNKKSPLWRPIADKKLVSSEYSKRWHENKYLVPSENLKVIGSPKYDFLGKITQKDKANILKKYKISSNEKIITIITAAYPWEKKYIDSALKAIKHFKNTSVIIKQHPEDPNINKTIIKKIIKKYGIKGYVTKDENTSLLIYASDFIITYNSTIINECILINKKVILFGPKEDFARPWIEEGLIKPTTTFLQMEKEIKSVFDKSLKNKKEGVDDEKARKKYSQKHTRYIKEYFYSDDGKASERAVDEIKKIFKICSLPVIRKAVSK